MKTLENKFFNINNIVNANSIKMVDGSKWVNWSLNRLKDGTSKRDLNLIASILT